MFDENEQTQDMTHFEKLRRLEFFTEFEDIELWEVLRISVWRDVAEKVVLIREGDKNRIFEMCIRDRPLVDNTSNWCSPSISAISMIETSKVPPPRS